MKGNLKKLIFVCLSVCLLGSFAGVGGACAEKDERLGLYAAEDGTLMKGSEAFYGVGVNYYSLLNCAFTQKWDVSNSLAALETLAEYDVRVIRFNIAGYAYSDWNYVIKMESKYFETLDTIVAKAEELGVGLFPCFFWNSIATSDYFDEPYGTAWASTETKTMRFIGDFTEKVVSRYAESPAIYGWEFGNEINLRANDPWANAYLASQPLPATSSRTNRTDEDKLTYAQYTTALKYWASVVKENDPHERLTGNGDAMPYSCAYTVMTTGTRADDTPQQHLSMLGLVNADLSGVSWHKYPDNDVWAADDPSVLGDYLGIYDTWQGFFKYMISHGKVLKKATYLGETGWVYKNATETMNVDTLMTVYEEIAAAALETDFPLTLFWNYDDRPDYDANDPTDCSRTGVEWSWNERWGKGKALLGLIRDTNKAFDEKHEKI